MEIPDSYVVEKFYQYAGKPAQNKISNVHYGCCPICREGKSWGRKKRLFLLDDGQHICCHNCGFYGDVFKFVYEAGGVKYHDVIQEIKQGEFHFLTDVNFANEEETLEIHIPELPKNSINLFDKTQVGYYKSNDTIKLALNTLKKRRLFTAINRPKAFYMSLIDPIHKDRICVPFYDENNKIIYYQTRALRKSQQPKYLSKTLGARSLFNFNQIDHNMDHVFVFEGMLDSCFVKNGVAVAGITEKSTHVLAPEQQNQIAGLLTQEVVWVLDSQWQDRAAHLKTQVLIDMGYKVFLWPEKHGKIYKDFNDMCCGLKVDKVGHKWILENSFTKPTANVRFSMIPQPD